MHIRENKGVVILEEPRRRYVSSIPSTSTNPKGKGKEKMVEEAIKEEDSSDEDIIGYKTVTIPIRRSMSSRVETIHVMTTKSVNDTVKKKLQEKGLTGDKLEKGIQDIMSIIKDALVDTGASYCLARPGILPSEKWIEIDQLLNIRMTNGDEFKPEYEAYDIPVIINGK
ncbi:hypothetical protein RJ640_023910 [Escallonia rubra]|uniref:Peptidase A3A domain-containing protein n=1 Tax=Escallonia rubra TaxID=112253 RepID=A0AA88RHX8_9ASTE|nr:hypothetical protein RJ640_023910 [Escallonia rubra]